MNKCLTLIMVLLFLSIACEYLNDQDENHIHFSLFEAEQQ